MPDKRSEKRSEQYRSLNNNASKKLADEIDRLNESKEKLSVEKVNMLLKLYEELGAELKQKYDNYPKDPAGNLDERVPEAKMLKKINKRFSKDYAALLRYKNKTEKLDKEIESYGNVNMTMEEIDELKKNYEKEIKAYDKYVADLKKMEEDNEPNDKIAKFKNDNAIIFLQKFH